MCDGDDTAGCPPYRWPYLSYQNSRLAAERAEEAERHAREARAARRGGKGRKRCRDEEEEAQSSQNVRAPVNVNIATPKCVSLCAALPAHRLSSVDSP